MSRSLNHNKATGAQGQDFILSAWVSGQLLSWRKDQLKMSRRCQRPSVFLCFKLRGDWTIKLEKKQSRLSNYSLIWGWGGRVDTNSSKRSPGGALEQTNWMHKMSEPPRLQLSLMQTQLSQSGSLPRTHFLYLALREAEREKPLPRRRLHAQDVICSHTNMQMHTPVDPLHAKSSMYYGIPRWHQCSFQSLNRLGIHLNPPSKMRSGTQIQRIKR